MRETMLDVTSDPDFIVVRASPDLPEGWMPPDLEGRCYDRRYVPVGLHAPDKGPRPGRATAVPTGRFEVRDDGAVAEIWEVRPW